MNDILQKLLDAAKKDESLRRELLDTRNAEDPMSEFCRVATEKGFPVTIGGLLTVGEELNCQQLKSTNGGGVTPYSYYDDAYEMFFTELELFCILKKITLEH